MNKLLASATALGSMLLLSAAPGAAHASDPINSFTTTTSNTTISCEIPNSVVCEVSDPDGVRRVVVKTNGLTLVDKTFRCETRVTVSWDSAYHSDEFKVYDCSSPWLRL
jgi:hypothetical protein